MFIARRVVVAALAATALTFGVVGTAPAQADTSWTYGVGIPKKR